MVPSESLGDSCDGSSAWPSWAHSHTHTFNHPTLRIDVRLDPSTAVAMCECSGLQGSSSGEKMAITSLLTSPKEPISVKWLATSTPRLTADATLPATQADAIAMKKRLQYKIYQRRHRAKQREKSRVLEQYVSQLTQQIAQLQRLKDQASIKAQSTYPCGITQPVELTREYLRLFEYGYDEGSSLQREFVWQIMDENVRGPQLQGVDDLLRQWQLHSRIFRSVHLRQRQLDVTTHSDVTVVEADITLTLHFKQSHVSTLFPRLLDDVDTVSCLVESGLTVQGSLRFVFDANERRVSWLASEMDFVAAFLAATGSLRKLGLLAQGSLLDLSSGYLSPAHELLQPIRPKNNRHHKRRVFCDLE